MILCVVDEDREGKIWFFLFIGDYLEFKGLT